MRIPTYVKVILTIAGYTLLSWLVTAYATVAEDTTLAFAIPMAYGAISSIFFLYVFEHSGGFKLADAIERYEMKQERKYLKMFSSSGKHIASFLIGFIGGPLFGALSVSILLRRFRYKYIFVSLVNIPSSMFYVALFRGIITIFS